ncbi:MAG: GHKL domain-containing protein [Clostridiales bacterium]|nr:GHKL domain-containing protein [Clostridiales bacterium]
MFYHPETAYLFYRQYHISESLTYRQSLVHILSFANTLMAATVAIHLMYPIIYLAKNHFRNRITFFSEQLASLAISLALLNLSFFAMFFTGVFSYSVKNVFNYGFWRYSLLMTIPVFYTTYLPYITLFILSVIFFIIARFQTNHLFNMFRSTSIRKNLDPFYTNMRNTMHSKKNFIFNIQILTQGIIEHTTNPIALENLNQIIAICSSNLQEISKLLNNIHNTSTHFAEHNLIDAIEKALADQSIPAGTDIIKNYQQSNISLSFDFYQLSEAISNILGNALEALVASQQDNPHIIITVYTSNSWCYFSITDNGCGMPKKILKKAYHPYVSTKSKQNSWGIGLSYVFNVVKAHYGHIRIKSQEGNFTAVEILLPRKAGR